MLITIEGIDGAGKTTQIEKIQKFLTENKIPSITTKEPNGEFRDLLLNNDFNSKTQLLLNIANRVEHINNFIKPALNSNIVILCDRYIDSTYAYQGYGAGLSIDIIDSLTAYFNDVEPDLTILLDVNVYIAKERIKQRQNNNNFDNMSIDQLKKIRYGFLQQAQKYKRIQVVNADGCQNETFEKIKIILQNLLTIKK